ncbi:3-dehydroshikimate dehydratase [Xylariaceae sp. FL0016]|nr:3-dehydroshikimate dehydratase [Xylariaceae sp. FL0016]
MPIPYRDSQVPTCYATCSVGHRDTHTLPLKLKAIADAGFDAIELSMPDILSYGKMLNNQEPDPQDYDALVELGRAIKTQAAEHGLQIAMLQPFANFEGWPRGSPEREDAFSRARGWMRIMEAVGTDMLQVGSSDAPGIAAASVADMARDLAELADLGAERGLRVAYENWCWATRAPDWRDVWRVVREADRPNLGLCLDTFQSAGGEWADPTTASGLLEGMEKAELESRWAGSLAELARTIPPEKIYILQISDAYKMSPPLEAQEKDGLRPRGRWSHDYRPLPYDGGYLPVQDFLNAVLATGFRGYLSMEVFDGKGPEKYDDMGEFCKKAMSSLGKLLQD